jgi:hypothetical protein
VDGTGCPGRNWPPAIARRNHSSSCWYMGILANLEGNRWKVAGRNPFHMGGMQSGISHHIRVAIVTDHCSGYFFLGDDESLTVRRSFKA